MKKKLVLIFSLLAIASGIISWMIFGNGTSFTDKKTTIYVYTNKATKDEVMKSIKDKNILLFPGLFSWVASQAGVWNKLKPGRYDIRRGESLFNIVRMFRNNQQTPVKLVINKVRTNEDLALLLAKNFEPDSTQFIDFINNTDSLQTLGVNYETLPTIIIPNTYTLFWSTSPGKILKRLKSEKETFWEKNNRKEKAEMLGFTTEQVSIIASIVEEETTKNDEKGNIASVYINRYNRGMPLGADPTIKFAMRNFGLKRIYYKYLDVVSPYNTYKNKGLPPGPICTPSPKTIDAVLDAPKTEYLFFVAKNDFSGYHTFSTNYAEHLQHAKEFSKAQDEQAEIRQQKNNH